MNEGGRGMNRRRDRRREGGGMRNDEQEGMSEGGVSEPVNEGVSCWAVDEGLHGPQGEFCLARA